MNLALQHLVAIAVGRELKHACHWMAYESHNCRELRSVLVYLGRCSSLLRRTTLTGPLPFQLVRLLLDLEHLGLTSPTTIFLEDLTKWVNAELKEELKELS